MTCVVAASTTHSGITAWRCCAAVEAAAVQGNKPWRRAGRDRCVLWVRTGRGGRAYKYAVDVGRRCMSPLCSSRWRLPRRTRRRRVVSVWCSRTRRERRVRAGRAGRRGSPDVCHRRRRSSACVAGVVTEHGATGVVVPGRVRGLGHAHDDDNDSSCNNFDDGEPVKIRREIVSTNLDHGLMQRPGRVTFVRE